ncbi:hypothetical protein CF15_04820 [Pyrodictium occultum]|uniref:Uncharacterized protein n=1 Tax=Pyrodictium occultum TaxID=2309 RepID=A0A0V8RVM8_PYROC|nr:hypothetical protein CF15_04820 [Pyrodictium occultum]
MFVKRLASMPESTAAARSSSMSPRRRGSPPVRLICATPSSAASPTRRSASPVESGLSPR